MLTWLLIVPQTQECESLTGVVQELTAGRAKAAAGRTLLQQR
jgi:hypothetical protein